MALVFFQILHFRAVLSLLCKSHWYTTVHPRRPEYLQKITASCESITFSKELLKYILFFNYQATYKDLTVGTFSSYLRLVNS